MSNNSPILFIEINNFDFIFAVGNKNENDHFTLIYSKKVPQDEIDNKRFNDFNLLMKILKENIYLIEKEIGCIFKEVILIIDNFNCSLINFTGFKKLNGSQLGKDNVTYIINDLKTKILETEKEKVILHIFNSNFLLDKKKINNLPIGLFGEFYSHELSFFLINGNDYKNLKNVFDKCNLRIKKIISKNFISGTKIINDNLDVDNFFKVEIYENYINISFFENSTLRFFQKFNFGSNLIINDISKVVALNKQIVRNILINSDFSKNFKDNSFVEKEFFEDQNFRKIKKQIIQDIANARLQEIAEITLLKNINVKSFLKRNLKIFLKIHDDASQKSFKTIYKNVFSNKNYELNFIKNPIEDEIYENAYNLVQYGWKREAVPIVQERKSLIRRFFDLFSD